MSKILSTKDELIPHPISKVSFGSIYCGAGFPILGALWAGMNARWGLEPRPYFNIKTFRSNFQSIMYSSELEAFHQYPVDVIWGSPSCGEISSSSRNSKNAKTMAMKEFQDFEY